MFKTTVLGVALLSATLSFVGWYQAHQRTQCMRSTIAVVTTAGGWITAEQLREICP